MASTLPHLAAQQHIAAPELAEGGNPKKLKLVRSHEPLRRVPWNAPSPIRLWHLASLDAPSVALVWTLAFGVALRAHISAWLLPLELLVVWTVYVGDRLLDARRGIRRDGRGMRDRHWFHWRHRRLLIPLALLAAVTALCISLRWMPAPIWGRDSVVGVASLAYFIRVHGGRRGTRLISKELLVGVLFTAGCALPSLSWRIAIPALFFACLAWLNCWAIDRWESPAHSAPVTKIALIAAILGLALASSLAALEPRIAFLLLAGAASAALIAVLDRLRDRFTALTLRAFADLVLLTPAIVLVRDWIAR